jgi:GTP-binding protein
VFVDQVRIDIKAGRGGDGICSFRREKFVPRGGPDGGDGGQGGDIVAVATRRMSTLLDLRYQQHYEAKPGQPGGTSNCHGKSAEDVLIYVPVGTLIMDDQTDAVVVDLIEDEQRYVLAKGGRGGVGNSHFATSTNRVPTRFIPGGPGEERRLRLDLKLLADVGLVGFPNAGKSTLIAAISAARPKIADYPFTTLIPNLGVVPWGNDQSFVVADIPGLIAGAHEGKGLGFQFLRHIERTSFLLHLVDISEWASEDPVEGLKILRHELETYDEELASRPYAVVGTKLDVADDPARQLSLQKYCKRRKLLFFAISAATGEGVPPLVMFVGQQVLELRLACAGKS